MSDTALNVCLFLAVSHVFDDRRLLFFAAHLLFLLARLALLFEASLLGTD